MYSDKLTQSIAKAATQVMDEQLKGDQHKIDKNKNGKVDAHDFKLLRKEKGLEEGRVGQVSADLTDLSHAEFQKEYGKPKSHFDPTNFKKPVQPGKEMDRAKALAQRGMTSMNKEEVEELDEIFPGTPEYEKKYGKAPQDMKPGEKKATTKGEMEKTEKGVVHKRKFSEMLEVYGDDGIKGLFEALQDKEELIEEPTNAEFTAELDDAKKRAAGTKKQPDVAKGAVQAVKNEEVESVEEQTHTSVSVIDYNDINGVKFSEIDLSERELTDDEMKDREKNVKGMKKSMEGFKERYGKDAKSIMFATATKMAKEK